MAALLVALGVMAVLMTAAMPVWRHEAQREREIETIFRGQQIARAIAMYREKNGGTFPSSLDLLVQQRFLRKKYKNPFSEDGEWQPIGGVGGQPQQPGGLGGRGGQAQPGPQQPGQLAGIMGVTLKDKATAIVEYKKTTHHNEWQFLFSDARSRAGGSQGGRSGGPGVMPPGRGNRPGGPGIGGPGRGPGGGRGPGAGTGRGVRPGPFGGPGRRGGGN